MKILFCTDGSKISYGALKNLSGWIKEAVIDTICVIDWSFLPDEINLNQPNFTSSCANVADTIINHAQKIISELGFKNGQKIKNCGSAIESILEAANENNYELILMGSNGKKGIQKWLGSVSQEIINSSATSDYVSKSENSKNKLLLTTDGTECSAEILKNILPKMKLEDKEIHICMVNEDPNLLFIEGAVDTNWVSDIQKQQNIYAANAIKKLEKILSVFNISITQKVILMGNPAQKIIEYAKENSIDLTILGSRNKSKLDRFLTGSESKRILENTMSDVLLIRCPK